ncbi:MAG TPA: hypothetical protein ENK55_08175 [Actinobacteria bacterium]|nr:hypothetical protein [Actinomycetota bacterium]
MTLPRDPLGKRALFETPPVRPEDPLDEDPLVDRRPREGKEALFSAGPHEPGTAVVECGSCGVRSRIPLVEAVVRVLAISLWIPGRRHNRWIPCPACHRRTWCRIRWLG